MALEIAVKPTVTITPIVTPSQEGSDFNASFMNFVGNTLDAFTRMDIVLILRIILIWIAIVWLVFAIWAAIDASSRYSKWYIPVLWFLFILPGNILGFIGYMLIRPTLTLEEQEYLDLESKYIKYELLKVVECPQCGTVLDSDTNYCPNCGYKMLVKCPSCGYEQSIFNKHCVKCGVRLNTEIVVNKDIKVEDTKIVKIKKANDINNKKNVNNARATDTFNREDTPGGIFKLSSHSKPNLKAKHLNINVSKLNPLPIIKKGAILIGNFAEKVGDITIKIVTAPIGLPVKFIKKVGKKSKKAKRTNKKVNKEIQQADKSVGKSSKQEITKNKKTATKKPTRKKRKVNNKRS